MSSSSSQNYLSDDDVVMDKPTKGFAIKGEAKKFQEKQISDYKDLKLSIKLFIESKSKIATYQKRRETLLNNKILPALSKEFKMIYALDQDKSTNIIRKKKYINKLFSNKNDATAFYKKHLQHLK
jgi:hypothetical protein